MFSSHCYICIFIIIVIKIHFYLFFFLVALSTRGLGHIVKMKSHEMHAQLGQLGLSLTMLLLALRSELSLVQCLRVKSEGVFQGRCNALMNSFQGVQLCKQISFTVLVNKKKPLSKTSPAAAFSPLPGDIAALAPSSPPPAAVAPARPAPPGAP